MLTEPFCLVVAQQRVEPPPGLGSHCPDWWHHTWTRRVWRHSLLTSWGFLVQQGKQPSWSIWLQWRSKWLWFLLWLTVVPGRVFLHVRQCLNLPTGAKGRSTWNFLPAYPDMGFNREGRIGPARCQWSNSKNSQTVYCTIINNVLISILVHTYLWDSEEIGFLENYNYGDRAIAQVYLNIDYIPSACSRIRGVLPL